MALGVSLALDRANGEDAMVMVLCKRETKKMSQ